MLTQETRQRIHDYIKENAGQIYEDLLRLAAIPSVESKDAMPGAPFGVECRRMLDETKALFSERGFEGEVDDDGYFLAYAGNTASDKRIGNYAHGDVVPVDDRWTVTKPFAPIMKDGYLYGRGVRDNKSAVVYALWTAKAIRDLKLPFDKKYEIFVGSNEETGMKDIKAYVKKHGYPDMGLVADSSYPCTRGEKCILHVYAYSPKLTELLDVSGGNAFNVCLSEVKVRIRGDEKFELLREKLGEAMTLSREDGDLMLTANGISKHAASPAGSVNAMALAAKLLAECGMEAETMETAAVVLDDIYGKSCGIAAEDPDFAPLTMANGIVRMEEGRLKLSFDIRFGPSSDIDTVYETLQAWFAARGWETVRISGTQGYVLSEDNPMVTIALEEYERFTGLKKVPYLTSGGTYARNLGGFAMPIGLELRVNPKEMPAGHGGSHQPDEMIEGLGLLRALEYVVILLLRFAELD